MLNSNGAHRAESKLKWFKFYASDWISDPDVTVMSSRQVGWYIRLIAYCWQEGGLGFANRDHDANVVVIGHLCQFDRDAAELDYMADDYWDKHNSLEREFDLVVSKFSLRLPDGRLTHPRLHQQYLEAHSATLAKVEAARITNAKRDAKRPAKRALRTSESISGSYKKDFSKETLPCEATFRLDSSYEGFYVFRDAWPENNRTGEDEAMRYWITLVDAGTIVGADPQVLAGLERWKSSERWAKKDGEYIPSMATWLSKKAWKDNPKQLEVDSWR